MGFETVAYNAATGARLWASAYQPAGYSIPRASAVSSDGATVFVTGENSSRSGDPTIAYDAATGRQLWVSRFQGGRFQWALAVSPDGTTVYVAGTGGRGGAHLGFALIAYAASTGKRRWLRTYATMKPAIAESVAVSPDGKSVYVTGSDGSALTVAYQATGRLQWAARYQNPLGGSSEGLQVVAAPAGSAVYVVGKAQNRSGQLDIATFAYCAATGEALWSGRHSARAGGLPCQIAVTPDGRSVIVTGTRNNGMTGGYLVASYNATTGRTQWAGQASASPDAPSIPAGLVIDPGGDAVFVASTQFRAGYDIAAYSVASGAVLWTSSYAAHSRVYSPVAIALNGDGTRLFVTGDDHGMTTVAYRA
jgi:DNA-binding beta-propeller fold protein YncE